MSREPDHPLLRPLLLLRVKASGTQSLPEAKERRRRQ
jgi:hypothetical protein